MTLHEWKEYALASVMPVTYLGALWVAFTTPLPVFNPTLQQAIDYGLRLFFLTNATLLFAAGYLYVKIRSLKR